MNTPNPRDKNSDLSDWKILAPLLTSSRRGRLETVAAQRTRKITLALQDIIDPHNIGACLRSAEGMGITNVHVIDPQNKYGRSSVAKGSQKWLQIEQWRGTKDWIKRMREQGFAIAGGSSHSTTDLGELPTDRPIALVFGNEHRGLDPEITAELDMRFSIPMVGMVESYNISVAAALTMYTTKERFRQAWGENFYLTTEEQETLMSSWARRDLKRADLILARARGGQPQLEILE